MADGQGVGAAGGAGNQGAGAPGQAVPGTGAGNAPVGGGSGAGTPAASSGGKLGGVAAGQKAGGASSSQPSQAAIDAATPTKGQAPGEQKTWDVKVDGRVVRMTEAEMLQAASLGKAAFKRMEEANGVRAQAEAFWKEFQADPMKALDKLPGLSDANKREMIEKYYAERYIAQDKLTPEQKELAELKREKAEREKRDKEAQELTQKQQRAQAESQWREHFTKVLIEGFEKAGLSSAERPATPRMIARAAFYLQQNAKNKINQPLEAVIERVHQDFSEEFQHFAGGENAPIETLVKILGPNALKKIQRYAVEQHRKRLAEAQGAGAGAPPTTPPAAPPRKRDEETAPTGEGWKKTTRYWSRRDK